MMWNEEVETRLFFDKYQEVLFGKLKYQSKAIEAASNGNDLKMRRELNSCLSCSKDRHLTRPAN